MTKEQIKELKYDFDCKVATIYRFLEEFALINGECSVYTALERFLDERGNVIIPYDKTSIENESD